MALVGNPYARLYRGGGGLSNDPYTILARIYLRTASTLQGLQTLDPFTDMYMYTGMYLAHPLDIVNTF